MQTEYIFTIFFIFVVIIFAVLGTYLVHKEKIDETTKFASLPYMPKEFLSQSQKDFYHLIRSALPPELIINIRTPLELLLQPLELSKAHQELQEKLEHQYIDFIIMNNNMDIVCLIEIDERHGKSVPQHASKALLNKIGYPTLSYDVIMKPTKDKIKEDIMLCQKNM